MTDFLFIFIFLCDHVTLTKNLRPKNNSRMHSRKIHSIIFCYKNVWLNLYSSTPLSRTTTVHSTRIKFSFFSVSFSSQPPHRSNRSNIPKDPETECRKHETQGRFYLRYTFSSSQNVCFLYNTTHSMSKMSFSVQTSLLFGPFFFARRLATSKSLFIKYTIWVWYVGVIVFHHSKWIWNGIVFGNIEKEKSNVDQTAETAKNNFLSWLCSNFLVGYFCVYRARGVEFWSWKSFSCL